MVLLSGGLDSAVLLAHEARRTTVYPVYVRVGLAWEDAERRMLRALLATAPFRTLGPLETLEFTMRDVYSPNHWAIRGTPPAYDTPDEDVYLTGRNLVLLTKAGIAAVARKADAVALGILANNPFPDATPEFLDLIARAMSAGLAHPLRVLTPFATLHKEQVVRIGADLGVALDLTLSCMNPDASEIPQHCGLCSKCRERRDAFAAAGAEDRTRYAHASPRM